MICGNNNDDNINKAFGEIHREMMFVKKDGNRVKYESLMWWNEVIKYTTRINVETLWWLFRLDIYMSRLVMYSALLLSGVLVQMCLRYCPWQQHHWT